MASLTDEQKNNIIATAEPLKPFELVQGETLKLEVPDFWTKHKNKAWVVLLLLAGAAGGNVDEIYKAIPDVHDVTGLRKEVATLRTDVDALKRGQTPTVFRPTTVVPSPAPELPPPAPTDDGFRVERPTK